MAKFPGHPMKDWNADSSPFRNWIYSLWTYLNSLLGPKYLYIPVNAGTPTGTPDTFDSKIPLVYDSTNNKLYVYNGAWKSVSLT